MSAEGARAIAIIIPVFNRAKAIERAIRSVLAQEFRDFELIVIDDGSTDATAHIVAEFKDPRLKLICQDSNCGSNAARNRGIREARAPLITFLDSDDAYLPHKLAVVARTFAEQPELDVLLDSFLKEYGEDDRRQPVPRINPVISDTGKFINALFNRRLWKATSAISIRREIALKAGLFDESLKRRQDFDFLIRASKVGRCCSISEVTWTKNWTPGAISDDVRTFASATVDLCARHPEYFDNPAFRPGLARDVARHFARLLKAGRIADAAADASKFRRQFSAGGFTRLLVQGSKEVTLRRSAKRSVESDVPTGRNSE